jgi:hypothetical protein
MRDKQKTLIYSNKRYVTYLPLIEEYPYIKVILNIISLRIIGLNNELCILFSALCCTVQIYYSIEIDIPQLARLWKTKA